MRKLTRILSLSLATLGLSAVLSTPGHAQQCGGNFGQWLASVQAEARAAGVGPAGMQILANARIDKKVLRRDRSQGVFAQDFLTFAGRSVSQNRLTVGKKKLRQYASLFRQGEQQYGVPGAVIAAFWGLETDYGAVQGDFNTINALATLAHDCRRPQLFRPSLIAAAKIVDQGHLAPGDMVGAWAGELGQTQFLAEDYLHYGTDADGNGRIDLKRDEADVIISTAKHIRSLGWRAGEQWLEEVRVSDNVPWHEADYYISHPRNQWAQWGVRRADGSALPNDGLNAALLLPMGRNGPAFLAYPNFKIYLKWNQSAIYTTTAAYFATRLAGAPRLNAGSGVRPLSVDQVKQLQNRLVARGYDVGKIDGVIGAKTREAVKIEQIRLGLPADSYPTRELLSQL